MKHFGLMERLTAVLMAVIIPTAFAGCNSKEQPKVEPLRKVTFVLDWTPNTNHTGIYAAQNQGFFKEQGLDVEIIQPTEGTSDSIVASGTAQFGISYQEGVTLARAEGVPLVSLAAVIQHNTSGFASLKDKNILSPKDFEGKIYGGWGSPIEEATIKYLMDKAGADYSKVKIISTGDADFFQASSSGQIDFAWIFEGWAGIEAKQKGMELNYIDLGKEAPVFDYYTPVIITNEETLKNVISIQLNYLKALAGMPADTTISIDTLSMGEVNLALRENSSFRVEDVPSFQLLQKQNEINELQIKNAKAKYIPQVAAFGKFDLSSYSTSPKMDKLRNVNTIGLQLSFPVFTSGINSSKVKQAQLRKSQNEENILKTRDLLSVSYNNALSEYETACKLLDVQKENRELALKVYNQTSSQYREGMASMADLLNVNSDFLQADNSYIQQIIKCNLAGIKMLKSSGKLRQLADNNNVNPF
jgi:ABC-type nitrate/sulfonate/bicarbonate transport system substrate-binding protein